MFDFSGGQSTIKVLDFSVVDLESKFLILVGGSQNQSGFLILVWSI